MAKVTVKIEGLSETIEALRELPKATAKNVLRRVLLARVKPIAEDMRAAAPVRRGKLRGSVTVGSKLSPRQRRLADKGNRDEVTIYAGPGPRPSAHLQEFGSIHGQAQPYVGPAWNRAKPRLTENLAGDVWAEIKKAAARLARKAARAAAKGG